MLAGRHAERGVGSYWRGDIREDAIDQSATSRVDPIPLFGPVLGGTEKMIILLVAARLFGANKVSKLARPTASRR